jgi:hypothetical protein
VTSSLTLWNHYTDYNSGSNRIGDRSGNNNIAIVSGSTLQLSGSLGLKMQAGNYFTYPDPVNATPTSDYTLQYYGSLNIGNPGDGNTPMWAYGTNGDGWWSIIIPEPAGPDAGLYYRMGGDKNITIVAQESTLQMVTMVCSVSTNTVTAYINTSSIGVMPGGGTTVTFDSSSRPFTFAYPYDASREFLGSVRDIVVYSKLLTQAEITTNYNGLSTL